jgi:hypothetical protein
MDQKWKDEKPRSRFIAITGNAEDTKRFRADLPSESNTD